MLQHAETVGGTKCKKLSEIVLAEDEQLEEPLVEILVEQLDELVDYLLATRLEKTTSVCFR